MGGPTVLDVAGLGALIRALRSGGRTVLGPVVRDDAIVIAELTDVDQLPFGWGADVDAGRYRLLRRPDGAAFAHSAGPQSWKAVLRPQREHLFTTDPEFRTRQPGPEQAPPRYALLGVRPCDLAALRILDGVLGGGRYPDPRYAARRADVLVIVANCVEPGGACFCVSMGGGPRASDGFDLALTEHVDGPDQWYLLEVGSEAGEEITRDLPRRSASGAEVATVDTALVDAAGRMGRRMPDVDLRRLLAAGRSSPRWEEIASRCLACGNCTMVCPTCFCVTTEDVTDLRDGTAERWQRWDTCFGVDFTHLHGGAVRQSTAARYRHWMTHKLSSWYDQFGTSGCVGCGRCVAWCPVGIDITEEAARLADAGNGVTDDDGD